MTKLTALTIESYSLKDGKRLWYRLLAERTAETLPEVHQKTNLANPSPTAKSLAKNGLQTGRAPRLNLMD